MDLEANAMDEAADQKVYAGQRRQVDNPLIASGSSVKKLANYGKKFSTIKRVNG